MIFLSASVNIIFLWFWFGLAKSISLWAILKSVAIIISFFSFFIKFCNMLQLSNLYSKFSFSRPPWTIYNTKSSKVSFRNLPSKSNLLLFIFCSKLSSFSFEKIATPLCPFLEHWLKKVLYDFGIVSLILSISEFFTSCKHIIS